MCLDAERRELTQGSQLVAVGPKVFDLLLHLVRNRDQVVTRDDLLAAVWDGRIVSESTLTTHVNAVRKAIGDTGKEQRLIRTIARKGMRFVGEVREDEPPPDTTRSDQHLDRRIKLRTCVARLPLDCGTAVSKSRGRTSYFADGVVEDIITALSHASAGCS